MPLSLECHMAVVSIVFILGCLLKSCFFWVFFFTFSIGGVLLGCTCHSCTSAAFVLFSSYMLAQARMGLMNKWERRKYCTTLVFMVAALFSDSFYTILHSPLLTCGQTTLLVINTVKIFSPLSLNWSIRKHSCLGPQLWRD